MHWNHAQHHIFTRGVDAGPVPCQHFQRLSPTITKVSAVFLGISTAQGHVATARKNASLTWLCQNAQIFGDHAEVGTRRDAHKASPRAFLPAQDLIRELAMPLLSTR